MAAQVQTDAAAAQDALRPLRNFVNTLAGVVNDQSWAGVDGYAVNQPYQYQTAGPNGYAIEGSSVSLTPQGGVVVGNKLLMLGLGAAVVYFLMK